MVLYQNSQICEGKSAGDKVVFHKIIFFLRSLDQLLGASSEIFRYGHVIFKIPGTPRIKISAFDSEKVGRYITNNIIIFFIIIIIKFSLIF